MYPRPRRVCQMCCVLALFAVLLIVGCAPKRVDQVRPEQAAREKVVEQAVREKVVKETDVALKDVAREADRSEPSGDSGADSPRSTGTDAMSARSTYQSGRMIIKNAELRLRVSDTSAAIDRVTHIAINMGGYLLASNTGYDGDFQHATLTISVPVDQFEEAMRRLREIGHVMGENATGTDVSDEFTDLNSRLRNLEATEARVRSFLEKATTVEESLRINQQLSDITDQIEQVKGRMGYLEGRSAYSTITTYLVPERPTPTVTPTATPRPTPTPISWQPGNTFKRASQVLGRLVRKVGDTVIWLVVVVAPLALGVILALWVIRRVWRWLVEHSIVARHERSSPPPAQGPKGGDSDAENPAA